MAKSREVQAGPRGHMARSQGPLEAVVMAPTFTLSERGSPAGFS